MMAFVVQVHKVVHKVLRTSPCSDRDTSEKTGGGVMQLTRAVIKKHTLPPMNAYKYHLAQPQHYFAEAKTLGHVLGQ